MKFRFKKNRNLYPVNKEKEKFLIIPLVYKGCIYWLDRVKVTKNFNGKSYVITSVEAV